MSRQGSSLHAPRSLKLANAHGSSAIKRSHATSALTDQPKNKVTNCLCSFMLQVKCNHTHMCTCYVKKTLYEPETNPSTFGRGVRLDALCRCPLVFNNDTLRVFMDVTPCSVSARALRLLFAYGCSFVLHAYCHVNGYSFVHCACCRAHFASRARGDRCARGDHLHLCSLATSPRETLAT